jgi:signal transduction histidine kinase
MKLQSKLSLSIIIVFAVLIVLAAVLYLRPDSGRGGLAEIAPYLAVLLSGMGVLLLVSHRLVGGFLAPIKNLSDATTRIAGGDLTYQIEVKSRDELGQLSASFNDMAAQLENQRSEITHSQQELEAVNKDLRAANHNYMEMLGFVAHELKNPLTSAVLSLHTVKDGYLGEISSAQQECLDSVAQSLEYFQDMIKNYLDLSRFEKGELHVTKTYIPLQTRVVQPVLEGLGRELEERGMVVVNEIPAGKVVYADANLLRIVYDNLVSNAVKYGLEGGTVVLDADESDDGLTLSVCNDSNGIPTELLPKLFRKFSRLDSPEYASKRGTGLGLYICKEIVEKHGGAIWVDSELGQWVRFSFTLPNQGETQASASSEDVSSMQPFKSAELVQAAEPQ